MKASETVDLNELDERIEDGKAIVERLRAEMDEPDEPGARGIYVSNAMARIKAAMGLAEIRGMLNKHVHLRWESRGAQWERVCRSLDQGGKLYRWLQARGVVFPEGWEMPRRSDDEGI